MHNQILYILTKLRRKHRKFIIVDRLYVILFDQKRVLMNFREKAKNDLYKVHIL